MPAHPREGDGESTDPASEVHRMLRREVRIDELSDLGDRCADVTLARGLESRLRVPIRGVESEAFVIDHGVVRVPGERIPPTSLGLELTWGCLRHERIGSEGR